MCKICGIERYRVSCLLLIFSLSCIEFFVENFFFFALETLILKIFFTGITGEVSINQNGDRTADYEILDMDPLTGRFRVSLFEN